MDEVSIVRVLRAGVSDGNEAFCEELLQRCLAVLDSGGTEGFLDDDTLDLLSAASDANTVRNPEIL